MSSRITYGRDTYYFSVFLLVPDKGLSEANDTILGKIAVKSHLYNGCAFNVTMTILDTYDLLCRTELCYVCKPQ